MHRTHEGLQRTREASRQRILDSALRLFARHGYAGTSVRMMAREAGISLGLLYNYYEGKEAVLRAIIDAHMADLEESLGRARGGATPHDRIESLVRAAFEHVRRNIPFWRLTYQLRMEPDLVRDLSEIVRAWPEAVRRRLEALLRSAGVPSPHTQARLLFATLDGSVQHYVMDPEHYPLDEVVGALIGTLPAPVSRAS